MPFWLTWFFAGALLTSVAATNVVGQEQAAKSASQQYTAYHLENVSDHAGQ